MTAVGGGGGGRNLLTATAHSEAPREWFYATSAEAAELARDAACAAAGDSTTSSAPATAATTPSAAAAVGPLSKSELRSHLTKGLLTPSHFACCRAGGAARPLLSVRELRWSVAARGAAPLPHAAIGELSLRSLDRLLAFHSPVAVPSGDPLHPLPAVHRRGRRLRDPPFPHHS